MAAFATQALPVDGAQVCLVTTQSTTHGPTAVRGWPWVLLLFVFTLGTHIGWRMRAWWTMMMPQKRVHKNKKTQSQCTYSFHNLNMRFSPVREREDGAWSD